MAQLGGTSADSQQPPLRDVLANVGHELRTPLNALLGMIAIARAEPLSPQLDDYLSTAQASAQGLQSLLNDLLDYADIQAGIFHLERKSFQVRGALQPALNNLQALASDRGLSFTHTIDERIPLLLVGDAGRLQQAMVNLVGNAIKFTPTGQVTLALDRSAANEHWVELQLTVVDSGVGLPAEDAQQMLKPFVQADATSTRKYGGVGLGLTIVNEIARQMNGRLSLEALPNQGTRATCWLRFGIADDRHDLLQRAVPKTKIAAEPPPTLRVLVAEDTLANQKVVRAILSKHGHEAEIVANGHEAVDRLQQADFDVVLMDAQMPTMNGLQATAAIRRLSDAKRAGVPIIALTAHTMRGDREKCLAAGMDDFLPKPVDAAALVKTIEFYGRRQHESLHSGAVRRASTAEQRAEEA